MKYNFFEDLFLRVKFIKNKIVISLMVLILLMTMMCIGTIANSPEGVNVGPFDILCNITGEMGILGKNFQATVIIPVYSFLVISIIDCEKNPMIVSKFKSRINIWNRQIRDSIIMSFTLTFLIVVGGYLIPGLILGDFNNYFSSTNGFNYYMLGNTQIFLNASKMFNTPMIFFVIFMSLFIGLNLLSVFIGTLKYFFSNKYIWAIVVSLCFYGTHGDRIYYPLSYTVINLEKWGNPSIIVSGSIVMILITIAFYFMGRSLAAKKDFINK